MKNFIILLSSLLIFSQAHADFRFNSNHYLQSFEKHKAYDEEIITLGGKQMTQKSLRKASGIDEKPECFYKDAKSYSVMDNTAFKIAVNTSVVASVLALLNAPKDKQIHGSIGAILGLGGTALCRFLYRKSKKDKRLFCALTGTAIGTIAGALKEWWDSTGRGNVDLKDFLATAIPAGAVAFSYSVNW